MSRTSKTAKNLFLDADAVARAEDFARRKGTNLSSIVNDYLETLSRNLREPAYGPIVNRLIGAGKPRSGRAAPTVTSYRRHLAKKYGVK